MRGGDWDLGYSRLCRLEDDKTPGNEIQIGEEVWLFKNVFSLWLWQNVLCPGDLVKHEGRNDQNFGYSTRYEEVAQL